MEKAQKTASAVLATAIALTVSNYFEQTGAKDTVYSTSDGFLFENLVFANNHATTLEEKNVTPHANVNIMEVVDEEGLTGDGSQLSAEQLELLNNGLVKENYAPLKQLADFLKLETTDKKAETIITALNAYKETL
ncbi:hypothetical protein SGQ83_01365 [Flavobacterium sp. Fl-318]|uniref:Uncharacterized protein n=1 Tax=Flavobacterium cupriresistens TaxID=2893885 RepID=A0ABU4R5X4_9FLAO|nr:MULTISPECIES: hypothetical protein [unclassified Flavobacterium]MDX6187984.1 hypothetical protein [Flavobacterium sp. Fl-318]UFH42096.1 hypothetical protein LNP23_20085 [Flavobacterium sp. F-323]